MVRLLGPALTTKGFKLLLPVFLILIARLEELQEATQFIQYLAVHVVFEFACGLCGLVFLDAQHLVEKLLEYLVPQDNVFGRLSAGAGQGYILIRVIVYQFSLGQVVQGTGDRGFVDPQAPGDLRDPCNAVGPAEVIDGLEIVLHAGSELGCSLSRRFCQEVALLAVCV